MARGRSAVVARSLSLVVLVYFPGIESAAPLHGVTSSATVAVPAKAARETWGVDFPHYASDYAIEVRSKRGWTTLASGRVVPLDGVVLPPLPAGGTLRLRATFNDDRPANLAPIIELRAQNTADATVMLIFAGFFAAMMLVNVISSLILRSAASAWYAGLTASMVVIMVYSVGWLRPLYGFAPVVQLLHSINVATYLGCVVAFGIVLLGALREDAVLARATIACYAANLVFLVCEDLLGNAWLRYFYAVDQIALDALLVMLVALGIRAFRRGSRGVAGTYLLAFVGPLAGLPLNDLVIHHVIAADWVRYTFEFGVGWEASFFAFAVALRNRALRSERDRFDQLAHLDEVTGVANRRTFDERLEAQWAESARTGGTLALAMVDIDFFKAVNDVHGHRFGDEVLRTVAQACAAVTTRDGDCFARYGGEEFAAILIGADIEGAAIVGERMRAAVERAAPCTISVGVASMKPASVPGDSGLIVVAADAALYRAKNEGRNRVARA